MPSNFVAESQTFAVPHGYNVPLPLKPFYTVRSAKKLDFGKILAAKYWTYTQHEEKYADFDSPRRPFPSDCF
jgi:hypothetical protein